MLEINLASRIYIDNRKLSIIIWLCGAVGLILLAVNAWLLVDQYQELQQVKGTVRAGAEKMRSGSRTVPEKDFQQLQEKIRFANGLLQRKGDQWLVLLDRLEQVLPDGVMLTGIEPETKSDSLKISGVALDFQKVRALYEAMGSGPLFKDVFLVSQSRVKVSDQQQGVTFQLAAKVAGP